MNENNSEIADLKNIVSKFCEERNWGQFHNPKDLAIMISTEAAELLSIFRYKDKEDVKNIMLYEKEDIKDELSDVLFGVLRFAELNDIDLARSLENKIKKNALKYPVDKSFGKNKKYDKL